MCPSPSFNRHEHTASLVSLIFSPIFCPFVLLLWSKSKHSNNFICKYFNTKDRDSFKKHSANDLRKSLSLSIDIYLKIFLNIITFPISAPISNYVVNVFFQVWTLMWKRSTLCLLSLFLLRLYSSIGSPSTHLAHFLFSLSLQFIYWGN